jgi:hypothetical protein
MAISKQEAEYIEAIEFLKKKDTVQYCDHLGCILLPAPCYAIEEHLTLEKNFNMSPIYCDKHDKINRINNAHQTLRDLCGDEYQNNFVAENNALKQQVMELEHRIVIASTDYNKLSARYNELSTRCSVLTVRNEELEKKNSSVGRNGSSNSGQSIEARMASKKRSLETSNELGESQVLKRKTSDNHDSLHHKKALKKCQKCNHTTDKHCSTCLTDFCSKCDKNCNCK